MIGDLCSKAVKYDAGPVVHNFGWIIPDGILVPMRCHYFIELTQRSDDEERWAIYWGSFCLSREVDDFVYECIPSNRDDKFLKDTRFDSAEEAFDFLAEWRVRELKRAEERGYKVWPHDAIR